MTTPRAADLEEQPAHESWETQLYVSEDAVPLVVIDAPYSRQYDYKDSTVTILSSSDQIRVVATIFDEAGVKSSTVTADEIRYGAPAVRRATRHMIGSVVGDPGRRIRPGCERTTGARLRARIAAGHRSGAARRGGRPTAQDASGP